MAGEPEGGRGMTAPTARETSRRANRAMDELGRAIDEIAACHGGRASRGEWRPGGSPEEQVRQAAEVARSYGLHCVFGDRMARAWVADAFRRHGITYYRKWTKDEIYTDFRPLMVGGLVDIVADRRLMRELTELVCKRVGKRFVVDHPRGRHDDLANVVAYAALLANANSILHGPDRDEAGRPLGDPATNAMFGGPVPAGYSVGEVSEFRDKCLAEKVITPERLAELEEEYAERQDLLAPVLEDLWMNADTLAGRLRRAGLNRYDD
jgi:hypothetical protein